MSLKVIKLCHILLTEKYTAIKKIMKKLQWGKIKLHGKNIKLTYFEKYSSM